MAVDCLQFTKCIQCSLGTVVFFYLSGVFNSNLTFLILKYLKQISLRKLYALRQEIAALLLLFLPDQVLQKHCILFMLKKHILISARMFSEIDVSAFPELSLLFTNTLELIRDTFQCRVSSHQVQHMEVNVSTQTGPTFIELRFSRTSLFPRRTKIV